MFGYTKSPQINNFLGSYIFTVFLIILINLSLDLFFKMVQNSIIEILTFLKKELNTGEHHMKILKQRF